MGFKSKAAFTSAWNKLVAAPDLSQALQRHFRYLADSPGFQSVLEEVMALATSAEVRTLSRSKQVLVVSFGPDDEELVAYPPDLKVASGYPDLALAAAKIHAQLRVGDRLILGPQCSFDFGAYDEDDAIYQHFEGDDRKIQEAMWDSVSSDTHWLYHASATNASGQPALFPVVHELEGVIDPIEANLGSVFLHQLVHLQQWPISVP